jgi:hypothetical protein
VHLLPDFFQPDKALEHRLPTLGGAACLESIEAAFDFNIKPLETHFCDLFFGFGHA